MHSLTGKKKRYKKTYSKKPTSSYKSTYTPKQEHNSEKKVTRSTSDLCKEEDGCVNTDPNRAFSLYEEAAKRGNEHAQYACAEMYSNGQGCKPDTAKALYWYEKSQLECGFCYTVGIGCSINNAKALYWYKKAAENGSAEGQFIYAVNLFTGYCGEQDEEKALYWYRKSANQGHVKSQVSCGFMYNNGCGCVKDE